MTKKANSCENHSRKHLLLKKYIVQEYMVLIWMSYSLAAKLQILSWLLLKVSMALDLEDT